MPRFPTHATRARIDQSCTIPTPVKSYLHSCCKYVVVKKLTAISWIGRGDPMACCPCPDHFFQFTRRSLGATFLSTRPTPSGDILEISLIRVAVTNGAGGMNEVPAEDEEKAKKPSFDYVYMSVTIFQRLYSSEWTLVSDGRMGRNNRSNPKKNESCIAQLPPKPLITLP